MSHIFSGIEIGRQAEARAAMRMEPSSSGSIAPAATAGAPALRVEAGSVGALGHAVARDVPSGTRARAEIDTAARRAAPGPPPDDRRASPTQLRAPAPSGSVSPPSGEPLPPRQPPASDDPRPIEGSASIGAAVSRLRQALGTVAMVDSDAAASRASVAAPERSGNPSRDAASPFGALPHTVAAAEPRAPGAALPSVASVASAPITVTPQASASGDGRTRGAPPRLVGESAARASHEAAARLGRGADRAWPGRDDRPVEAPLSFGVEPLHERAAAAARAAQHLPVHARVDAQGAMPSAGAAAATTGADASRNAAAPAHATPLPLDVGRDGQALGMALGHRLIALARSGEQRARIALHPAELGAIEIRINLRDEAASVAITAQQPQARELIETNIPRLRELFADQGLSLVDVDVSGDRDGAAGRADEPAANGATRATSAAAQPALGDDEPERHTPSGGRGARLLDVLA